MFSNDELRVLHVADSADGGGAEKVFRQTVEATREIGCRVWTYTADGRRNPFGYVYSARHRNGLLARIEHQRPDVIHVQNFYHHLSPSVLMAARKARRRGWAGKVVLTAHDYHLVCPNSGFQRFSKGRAINLDPERPVVRLHWRYDRRSWLHSLLKLLQHLFAYRWLRLRSEIDVVLAPGEFIAEVLRRGGMEDVRTVRNPVDGEFLNRSSARRHSAKAVRLVFAGRLAPEKGIVEFVNACDRLAANHQIPPTLIEIFGGGPEAAGLMDVAERAAHVRVELCGFVTSDELADRMLSASAFVLPSRWFEVSPLSILEAGALGLPVIVPDVGGLAETAALTERSFLYSLDDDESLAAAIRMAHSSGRNSLSSGAAVTRGDYGLALGAVYRSIRRAEAA